MDKHLFETKIDSTQIYDGKILNVSRDTVRLENGETAYREVIHHSGGVCVLPLDENGDVKRYKDKGIWLLKNGKPERVNVVTGVSDDDKTEIISDKINVDDIVIKRLMQTIDK